MESVQIFVVKKNGEKQLFDKSKLLVGVLKATQKRPVNAEEIVNQIELDLQNSLRQEVSSQELGEMVMHKLKDRDEVAYVRFAISRFYAPTIGEDFYRYDLYYFLNAFYCRFRLRKI